MSLLGIVILVLPLSFWMFCSYMVSRFLKGCPEEERVWIDRTQFRRGLCIAAGPLFWIGFVVWGIGSLLVEEGNAYRYVSDDEDYEDGGIYY